MQEQKEVLVSVLSSIKGIFSTLKRGMYEGGKITQANRDFYNSYSPFEDTAMADRATMASRARWLKANNPIMANIDNALRNNIIGSGIMPQSKSTKYDDEIDTWHKEWVKYCNVEGLFTYGEIQSLILDSRFVDGEIFIYLKYTKEGLKLQLFEMDSLDESKGENGIKYNTSGRPIEYYFIDYSSNNTMGKKYTINAKYIIHYFKPERATQRRGISEYKQAIVDIKNFSAFQSTVIASARARASVAYVVKGDVKNSFVPSTEDDRKLVEINGAMVYYLRNGESIERQAGESGGLDYKPFVETTVRMMATARQISYELAYKDYSQVNFASSRQSLNQDNKRFDAEQDHIIEKVLDIIYERALEYEVMRGGFSFNINYYHKNKGDILSKIWMRPVRSWVDPLKDMLAIEKAIKLNLTTETDEARKRGQDIEDIFKTKQKEIEMMKKYGIYESYLVEQNKESRTIIIDENDYNKKDDIIT